MTDRTPLGELYDAVTSANGWSLRDVERRAGDRGLGISKSRISQLVGGPIDSISAEKIFALADGLGVAPERVALAAVQSMGFRVAHADLTPAEAIMRDSSLSEDTRRALLAILDGTRGRRRGAS